MPIIRNKTIHSYSSEDPSFPAKNLLDNKNTARWKCKSAGEKQAFVVLKLDKPYHIDKLDIGNEWSAFMEILVGNSKQDPPEYKELLLTSSFMTEKEARNEQMPNRIRFFERQSKAESVVAQQWDLVKIICLQPFNTRKQFGVAFITLYTPDEVEEEEPPKITSSVAPIQKSSPSPTKSTKKIGKFVFKDSSEDEDENDESSNFKKWKMRKDAPKSQIKAKLEETRKRVRSTSGSSSDGASEKKSFKKKIESRNRSKGLMYASSDDEPNEKLQKKIDKDRENQDKLTPKPPVKSPSVNKFSSFIDNSASTSSKPSTRVKTPKKEPQYKPFDKLLDGVTFVISGYQNPERGILRQKALDMGAKYKGDWDGTCTHLICCFVNTPKFNQVKGKGKIVSAKWIENCFTEQKRLPWRRYAMDRDDKTGNESEEEILCELSKKKVDNESDSDGDMLVVDHRKKTPEKKVELKVDDSDDDDMVVIFKQSSPVKITIDDDDDDNNETDPHVDEQQKGNEVSYDSESSIDITAVECEAFKGKILYLNQDLPSTTILKFVHIIKHMLGVVTKDASKAHYIITKEGKNLPKNSKAEIVKDTWVQECHELQAFIPTTRYRL